MEEVFCNVLILGSGGAALSCGIKLHNLGLKDIVITSKTTPLGSHTIAAKGGINASLSSVTQDKWEWHAYDTMKASCFLGKQDVIDFMCKNAPLEIEWLEKIGVNFDKMENGKILQRRYGGQKTDFGKGDYAYRSCFVKDETGKEIMQKLFLEASRIGLTMFDYYFAFDITKNEEDDSLESVLFFDIATGKIKRIFATYFVFATGGYSQIYQTNSSSSVCTGDGHILALKAGVEDENMEFVQFHPTGLKGSGILISEAVRAEGGVLLNSKKEHFMHKYSDMLELAPRDVIARAIFEESCGGTLSVFLSIKHLDADIVKNRLKNAIEIAKYFANIDFMQDDIEVFPTAHYNMGGIKVNFDYQTKIHNLFCIGELASAGIHGANRLGCNSLLELFTSSSLASKKIFDSFKQNFELKQRGKDIKKTEFRLSSFFCPTFEKTFEFRNNLQQIMDKYASVCKSTTSLELALKMLLEIEHNLELCQKFKVTNFCYSSELVCYLELKNMIQLAKITLNASLARKESIGSHFIIS